MSHSLVLSEEYVTRALDPAPRDAKVVTDLVTNSGALQPSHGRVVVPVLTRDWNPKTDVLFRSVLLGHDSSRVVTGGNSHVGLL
jgi:hypothetical protein